MAEGDINAGGLKVEARVLRQNLVLLRAAGKLKYIDYPQEDKLEIQLEWSKTLLLFVRASGEDRVNIKKEYLGVD